MITLNVKDMNTVENGIKEMVVIVSSQDAYFQDTVVPNRPGQAIKSLSNASQLMVGYPNSERSLITTLYLTVVDSSNFQMVVVNSVQVANSLLQMESHAKQNVMTDKFFYRVEFAKIVLISKEDKVITCVGQMFVLCDKS